MGNVKTNYRILTREVIDLPSYIIHIRKSLQHDSAAGGVLTFSLDGYGIPSWVNVRHASVHSPQGSLGLMIGNISVSDASIIYVNIGDAWSMSGGIASGGSSVPLASLAATVTFPLDIFALIASR